jgi:dTDP-D-glucose 4,6-dehydratase
VSSCFDDKPEVIIKGKPDGEIDRYVPRVEKIKNELCVSERMTLVDGIKRTIDFHMKN